MSHVVAPTLRLLRYFLYIPTPRGEPCRDELVRGGVYLSATKSVLSQGPCWTSGLAWLHCFSMQIMAWIDSSRSRNIWRGASPCTCTRHLTLRLPTWGVGELAFRCDFIVYRTILRAYEVFLQRLRYASINGSPAKSSTSELHVGSSTETQDARANWSVPHE